MYQGKTTKQNKWLNYSERPWHGRKCPVQWTWEILSLAGRSFCCSSTHMKALTRRLAGQGNKIWNIQGQYPVGGCKNTINWFNSEQLNFSPGLRYHLWITVDKKGFLSDSKKRYCQNDACSKLHFNSALFSLNFFLMPVVISFLTLEMWIFSFYFTRTVISVPKLNKIWMQK